MPKFRTLDDIDVRGKRVLLRTDLNVPVKDDTVTDATRIERLAPTIEALIDKGAKVIVMSHFGRPKGKPDPAFSLRPLVTPLENAIGGRKVVFAANCVGEEARRVVAALRPGEVALLENLRFHEGEEANSLDFARALAELGDVYVDDAFSTAHRAHASIDALARLLPAAAGKLMEAELDALTAALERPARPVLALIGGAKVSTKLDLLRFIIGKVDLLAIGGAMANTLLLAEGKEIGHSLCEREMTDIAHQLLALARERNCRVILPEDAVVAGQLAPGIATREVAIDAVPPDFMILDIGTKTVARIGAALDEASTLVWNGPLGAFETPPFDHGTNAVAKRVAKLTGAGKLLSVAGGGDTVAALAAAGVAEELSYVSTAGGAFLEWLEGRELPGVAALSNAASNRRMKASDVMTRTVVTVGRETRVAQAIRLMLDNNVSGLPVLDDAGKVVGVLTEGDLLRRTETGTERHRPRWIEVLMGPGRIAAEYVRTHGRKVEEIMTSDVVSVTQETPLDEVVGLMERRRIKRLPVLDHDVLVGIVSRADLLRSLLHALEAQHSETRGDDEILAQILAELAKAAWVPRDGLSISVKDGVVDLNGVILDEKEREALRVVAENAPGVRAVEDHLVWIEPMSGTIIEPPA